MENPSASEPKVDEVRPKVRKGRGAKAKGEEKFRRRKNDDFHAELQASILKRLKITDPTNLNAVKLQSAIPPARIPISLCGLPYFMRNLWARMKSIGTRPFATLATEDNYAIFLKCAMFIAETRVIYAQMKCEAVPPFPMSSLLTLSEMQLRVIRLQSSRLPTPLVLYMESIGNFTIRKQLVVPVEMTSSVTAANGAISFFPSSIRVLLDNCRCDINVDSILFTIGQRLSRLPKMEWLLGSRQIPEVPAEGPRPLIPAHVQDIVRISHSSLMFWTFPTLEEWMTFNQIIASMEAKKGFLLQFDVTTGMGSSIQIVRFPEVLDEEEEETTYYMNDEVTEYDEKMASAFLFGHEYGSETSGRFSSSYSECYKHGTSSQIETRHAVIWADNFN